MENPNEEQKASGDEVVIQAKIETDILIGAYFDKTKELLEKECNLTVREKAVIIMRASSYIGTSAVFRFAGMSEDVIKALLLGPHTDFKTKPHFDLKDNATIEEDLYRHIQHGDEEHRSWLKRSINDFFKKIK